jgi:uncharacterized protein YjbI with pentapeptide repeats
MGVVEKGNQVWDWYVANREHIAPLLPFATGLLTFIAGSVVAWAVLKQARIGTRNAEIATRQAEIARLRHEEQTKADLQRRITESFTKAVEQLGSDKLQVRLGGIYTLERISRESELDYWPVMETLTGLVRERARWKVEASALPRIDVRQGSSHGPPTDVAAVLTVIKRRDPRNRERERSQQWHLDLGFSDLRQADLRETHLEGANLERARLEEAALHGVHLERANLNEVHLEGANLHGAHLERAVLYRAHLEEAALYGAHLERAALHEAHLEGAILYEARLEGADLHEARLEGAVLYEAHLEGANLYGAHLEGAKLAGAHLEGANLHRVNGLTQHQLDDTSGNAETVLPEGLTQPAHWPAAQGTS